MRAAIARPSAPRSEVSIERRCRPKEGDDQDASKRRSLRSRLGAAIPDFQENEPLPAFGRAKRDPLGDEAVDLDLAERLALTKGRDAEYELNTPDDFVAAARRAAQAAAAQAEERGGSRVTPGCVRVGLAKPAASRKDAANARCSCSPPRFCS